MADLDFTSLAKPHDLKCKTELSLLTHELVALTPDFAVITPDLWASPKVLTNESAI
jgi:hypothetical protein